MEVLLLTREDCAFCHDAEEILGRLSKEYAVRVRTVDLDTPEGQELGERGGVLLPPGILIDGRGFSYGRPSERKLRRELEKHLGPVERT
jgi:glutaredoxin